MIESIVVLPDPDGLSTAAGGAAAAAAGPGARDGPGFAGPELQDSEPLAA